MSWRSSSPTASTTPVGPPSGVDDDRPRQFARRAEQLLVEVVAPTPDRLGERDRRRGTGRRRREGQTSLAGHVEPDGHAEEQAVETFARALVGAGEHYLENRLYAPLLPNWNRMVAAMPDIMEELEMLPYKDHKAVLG